MAQLRIDIQGGRIIIPENNKYIYAYCDPELRARIARIFKLYKWWIKRIFRKGPRGRIIVNWYEYNELLKTPYSDTRSSIRECINLLLLISGALTDDREGAWTFTNESMNLCWTLPDENYHPSYMSLLYFKTDEDILAYADAFCRDYTGWGIYQMKGFIKREEII
jgi:hypothetical protein